MVYNILPRLHDTQTIDVENLLTFSTIQEAEIIHPNIIMRDQPFDIVAIVPPGVAAGNHYVVFFKDASIWCDKMQQYEEIFAITMSGVLQRVTVGKEFWENCPLDTEKIGIAIRCVDTWNNQKYLLFVEASIGRPGTVLFNVKFYFLFD